MRAVIASNYLVSSESCSSEERAKVTFEQISVPETAAENLVGSSKARAGQELPEHCGGARQTSSEFEARNERRKMLRDFCPGDDQRGDMIAQLCSYEPGNQPTGIMPDESKTLEPQFFDHGEKRINMATNRQLGRSRGDGRSSSRQIDEVTPEIGEMGHDIAPGLTGCPCASAPFARISVERCSPVKPDRL